MLPPPPILHHLPSTLHQALHQRQRRRQKSNTKRPPQKIAYIASKIEEKLVDIEIESRKEIDQLFQKFSVQIRASVAAHYQEIKEKILEKEEE
uniref:Uncharacterized protein n=1 Tax=Panagrolaimus superbus TaxID=310955 RepID=A0A914XT34_9BILA